MITERGALASQSASGGERKQQLSFRCAMSKRATVKAPSDSAAGPVDGAKPHRAIASQQPAPGTNPPAKEVTGDLRRQMIAAAAYYRAEQRGFGPGCELEDWVAAETQVVEHGGAVAGDAGLACYADAPHHEYPQRLQEMVDRAIACCSREECSCIEEVLLCQGDIAEEILDQVERKRVSLLALGWHGSFATGHAEVVKRLLGTVACPVLLVKPSPRAPFVLRVGDALEQGTVRGEER